MASPFLSRREMLRRTFFLASALAMPSAFAFGREYKGGVPWSPGAADVPHYGTIPARFLTVSERNCIAAMAARLIPSDEDGPGAPEADVITFIDRQLAGFYGTGQRWYMQGPFEDGASTQGYQAPFTPAQLYRAGVAALNQYSLDTHGRVFDQLEAGQQNAILTGLDDEEIELGEFPAKTFFDLVLENTIEGFFADPIYGGNRDMVGWRYVGFPGARYDYRDFVHHNGARIDLPPVGLMGRPEWTPG